MHKTAGLNVTQDTELYAKCAGYKKSFVNEVENGSVLVFDELDAVSAENLDLLLAVIIKRMKKLRQVNKFPFASIKHSTKEHFTNNNDAL